MAVEQIRLGRFANDPQSDNAREAFDKVQRNLNNLDDRIDGLGPLSLIIGTTTGTAADGGALTATRATVLGLSQNKLDATATALLSLLDALPVLPANPSSYPAQGGLFREGDANGYRLVRIYPAS